MMLTRRMVAVLRVLHGMSLTAATVMTGWLLIAVLEAQFFRHLPMRRAPEYLALYTGWLIVQLFIAWCAWRRFEKCPFRTSAVSYSVWLLFFVWHGWFTEWAPFRIHEVLMPGYSYDKYIWMTMEASLWVMGLAIFPSLRYAARRSDGRHAG